MTYPLIRRWLSDRMALDSALLTGAAFDGLVQERLRELGCENEHAYLSELERSGDEGERLAASIAVPETWFFRYPSSFALLVEHLAGLLGKASRLRMLSVGCASGEEAYGMAMAALHAGWASDRVRIDAIDRSGVSLERAKAARYGAFSLRHELPSWAIEFLRHEGTEIAIDERVRGMVRFRLGDILERGVIAEGGPYEVVFCRNVMIYLSADARRRLLGSISENLSEGGLFFVGHAEQLLATGATRKRLDRPHAFALERTIGNTQAPVEVRQPLKMPERVPVAAALPKAAVGIAPKAIHASQETERDAVKDLDDARDLADAGKNHESEELIRSILARKGPTAAALELLGTLRRAANDTAGAKTAFEQALYLEPSRATSLVQLALIYEGAGDRVKAERMWERLKRAPTNDGGTP
ncbi:MAG: CheR family methyltransferase [Phycisphaerales bacterium]